MNQYYPAIFYPRLILKFIAENPTPNFKQHSHIIDSNQAHLPNKETNDSNYILNKIFYILICINLFIFICFYSLGLYPIWLIVAVWASINLGCLCFISNLYEQSSKKNIPSSIQLTIKKENKTVMRLPKREAKLNLWLNGKVLQPVGESDAQNGVSEKTFYQITKRVFPNIVQGVAFHNPKFSHPYSADFLIVRFVGELRLVTTSSTPSEINFLLIIIGWLFALVKSKSLNIRIVVAKLLLKLLLEFQVILLS